MKHKSNRTKIKIDFFIARIARFPRPTSGIMRKLMRKTYLSCFCYDKIFFCFKQWDLGVSLLFFVLIWYLWPLFQHENNSVDENKLTFTNPLDGSSNNQSCGRDSSLSLKIGIHILSEKLNRKYKCFWCFTWLSLVEIGVSNFALMRPKIVFLPEINCWKLEYLEHLTRNRYEYFRNFFPLEMSIC